MTKATISKIWRKNNLHLVIKPPNEEKTKSKKTTKMGNNLVTTILYKLLKLCLTCRVQFTNKKLPVLTSFALKLGPLDDWLEPQNSKIVKV